MRRIAIFFAVLGVLAIIAVFGHAVLVMAANGSSSFANVAANSCSYCHAGP